ncbi:unnamed protein product [Rotaria sordida]|uniref:Uncharacterized protein n=1 Tax=Rotaria sordida TaxID=392033 RepID=A0A814NL75_9BILA|nr:unnamed protein product [Rotaria sordida]CAF3586798.1 unnamed protein product [Rotaria sordida]CAF3633322.1 unnamed protein product [Rotaria sordida]
MELYEMLPDSLLNRTQICQINCTQNQTMLDNFKKISGCIKDHFKICEGYLSMDFNTQLVSYSLTTADAIDIVNENSSLIRADLVTNYLSYIKTNITAIRFRQLKMKFSKTNPHRLNINYFCRTQIDDCAYQEIETIYPVYIANQHMLKRIQPIFYDLSISYGTKIECMNDISNETPILCSGYCTLTLDFHTMTKGCNETLSSDALGINISFGLAYPNNPKFTAQVSSLVLVCNKPNCNSNTSITKVIAITNAFLTAQSIGVRMIVIHRSFLLFYGIMFFLILLNL